MIYNFQNISTQRFSLNGRESYKTFIPFFVDDSHIVVLNVYDSKLQLTEIEDVSKFSVNGSTYANSKELINALHSVVFSPSMSGGDIDLSSIETEIAKLKNGKADKNHTHDDRYYTETEIDEKLSNLGSGESISKGVVDNDKIKFYNSKNQKVFQIDAKKLVEQGTSIVFENGKLVLKNNYGESLSATEVRAIESYYDKFTFVENVSDDLNFVLSDNFQLVKTTSNNYYFFSREEDLTDTKIYLNELDQFFQLTDDNKLQDFNAWELEITEENFYINTEYYFNIWGQKGEFNYFIFETKQDADDYLDEKRPEFGTLCFIKELDSFYYVDSSEDAWKNLLTDFLKKPTQNATNQYVLLADGTTSPKSNFGKVDTVNNVPPDENKNVNVDLDDILKKGNSSEKNIKLFNKDNESILISEKSIILDRKLMKIPADSTGIPLVDVIESISNNNTLLKKVEILNENYSEEEEEEYGNIQDFIETTYYGNSSIKVIYVSEFNSDEYLETKLTSYKGFEYTSSIERFYTSLNRSLTLVNYNDLNTPISQAVLESEKLVIKGIDSDNSTIRREAAIGTNPFTTAFGSKPSTWFLEENPSDLTNLQQIVMYNVDGIYSYSSLYGSSTENPITNFHIKLPKVPTPNKENYVVDFRLKSGIVALVSDIQSIFSQYTNWTNAQQRFSALVSKHNDATYNRLLGMDSNGNVNEVGLPAMTNEMSKSTDAQKDAWRLANQKSTETNYSIKPLITMVDIVSIPNGITYPININISGVNLNMVQTVNLVKVRDENGSPIIEESVKIETFTRVSATLITVSLPPNIMTNGWVVFEVTDNFISASRSEMLELTNNVRPITPPIITDWEYIGDATRDKSRDSFNANKVTLLTGTAANAGILNRAKYKANFKITLDMIDKGFEVTIKTTGTDTPVYGQGQIVPSLSIVDSNNNFIYQIDRNISQWSYYNIGALNINGNLYNVVSETGVNTPTAMTILTNSTYTIKFKGGIMSLLAIKNDNTVPHYKSPPIYVPISANVIANGLFICVDLSDRLSGTISAEVTDFKLLEY